MPLLRPLLARAGDPRSPASYRPGDIDRQLMLAQRLEAACGGGPSSAGTTRGTRRE